VIHKKGCNLTAMLPGAYACFVHSRFYDKLLDQEHFHACHTAPSYSAGRDIHFSTELVTPNCT